MSIATREILHVRQFVHAVRHPAPSTVTAQGFLARAVTHWRIKIVLAIVMVVCVQLPYFVLNHHVFFPVTTMPTFALDHVLPFVPLASWVYLGIYPVALNIVLRMVRRQQLVEYGVGLSLIGLVSNCAFLFFPTAVPRPATGDVHFLYVMIRESVTPLCACPSLHASMVILFTMWGNRMVREEGGKMRWRVALWAWWSAILWSTLATKQHVILDLVGGTTVGLASYLAVRTLARYRTRRSLASFASQS